MVLALGATRAHAQGSATDPGRTEAARTLFEEGLALVDQERWQEAAERFRRALELRPSPVITFNLASALAKQGKAIEGSELLRVVVQDESAGEDTREAARQLLADVDHQIARLTIEVRGDLALHTILLDERALHTAEVGVALPVDPGPHLVVAKRGELSLFRRELSLAPGSVRRVTLDLPTAGERPVAPDTTTREAGEPDESDGLGWLPWVGVGVVAAGVAVVLIVVASSRS
jgi:tetratricopeptide (TPR) repeat protein